MTLSMSRLGGWLADLLGVALVVSLVVSNLSKFDASWDFLYYHLPFAGLRTGLLSAGDFIQRPDMAARMAGFPPAADLIQGWLWWAFGTPQAATLPAPIAISCLALYLRLAYRVRLVWTVLVFAAVPILHTALDIGYIDLWTNAFFALHLLAAERSLSGTRHPVAHAATSGLALAIAAASKAQFCVIGAASVVLVLVLLVARAAVANAASRRPRRLSVAAFVAFLPLAFFVPTRNLIVYGNPVYPEAVKIANIRFAGPESNVWVGPTDLGRIGQPARYILSLLELEGLNGRMDGYTMDQAEIPVGMPGFRMGGSLSVLLVGALGVLVAALARVRPALWPALAAAGFAVLTVLVAGFPGSNELRYFSFVEIVLILALLALLEHLVATGDEYARGLRAATWSLLVGAAVFVAFITGFSHVSTRRSETLAHYVARQKIVEQVATATAISDVICYTRLDQDAVLYTRPFHNEVGSPYSVVGVYGPELCPPGSVNIP